MAFHMEKYRLGRKTFVNIFLDYHQIIIDFNRQFFNFCESMIKAHSGGNIAMKAAVLLKPGEILKYKTWKNRNRVPMRSS